MKLSRYIRTPDSLTFILYDNQREFNFKNKHALYRNSRNAKQFV